MREDLCNVKKEKEPMLADQMMRLNDITLSIVCILYRRCIVSRETFSARLISELASISLAMTSCTELSYRQLVKETV